MNKDTIEAGGDPDKPEEKKGCFFYRPTKGRCPLHGPPGVCFKYLMTDFRI